MPPPVLLRSQAMRIRALSVVAFGSLAFLAVACGGAEQPAAAPASEKSAAPAPDGGASESDLYAGFDGGALEKQADEHAAQNAPPPTANDLGAVCQKAAQGWEKRARPALKACYREGKKKDPNLMGTARILVDVAFDGKPKPAKLDGPSSLGDDVAACMTDAVTRTPFPEAVECKTRQLTIPIEFPTPH